LREGALNISSLKSGDGTEDGGSLFLIASEECVVTDFVKNRSSLHFVPSLTQIVKESNDTHTNLTFLGGLLLPCHLSYQLIFVNRSGSIVGSDSVDYEDWSKLNVSKEENNFTVYVNESYAVGTIELEKMGKSNDTIDIWVSIIFDKKGNECQETSRLRIKNAMLLERIAESTGMSKNQVIILICGIIGLLLIVGVIVAFVVYRRKKRKGKKNTEKESD
jgi:subtilase family serine protease